jgi:hypothetical protein
VIRCRPIPFLATTTAVPLIALAVAGCGGGGTGQGVKAFGGRWYVLSPAGTMVSGSDSSTNSYGSGG